MKKTINFEKLFPFFYLALIAFAFIAYPSSLYADNPFNALISKFEDVEGTIFAIGEIIAVIGIVVGGVKFALGHPDAWGWLWKSGLGGFIIFSADKLYSWLTT